MSDSLADKVRGLLASDVCSEKGRLRSDDLLVRERVGHGLSAASARIRDLISEWRQDRVPPSTREQPFPPAEVMAPIRRCDRLIKAIEDTSATVRGPPLLNADKVWDRVRHMGLEEMLQFDWTIVGEADGLAADVPAAEARLRKIREVAADPAALHRDHLRDRCETGRPVLAQPAGRLVLSPVSQARSR